MCSPPPVTWGGGGGAEPIFTGFPLSPPKIPSELISLDPGQLGTVDTVTLEQQHKERVERLVRDTGGMTRVGWRGGMTGREAGVTVTTKGGGKDGCCGLCVPHPSYLFHPLQGYDPQAKNKFSPRRRLKGRDSAGGRLRRKKKVAAEEKRVGLGPPYPGQCLLLLSGSVGQVQGRHPLTTYSHSGAPGSPQASKCWVQAEGGKGVSRDCALQESGLGLVPWD